MPFAWPTRGVRALGTAASVSEADISLNGRVRPLTRSLQDLFDGRKSAGGGARTGQSEHKRYLLKFTPRGVKSIEEEERDVVAFWRREETSCSRGGHDARGALRGPPARW